jgi:hypothetical protein
MARRFFAFSLVAALSATPALAAGLQAPPAGSIAGVARNTAGSPVGQTSVQLRNLATGEIAGTATSDAAGQFSFAGLTPGNYSLELLNAAGEIVGTSSAITVSAGAAVTGVSVTSSVLVTAATGSFFASTAGLITAAAAGAAVAGVSVATSRRSASPSR